MSPNREQYESLQPEGFPTEIHRAVSEKVQRAISSMLNQRIEKMVEEKARKEDIKSAADQLFHLAENGATEEEIEAKLKLLSARIASDLLGQ
jgi:hypothetical protein